MKDMTSMKDHTELVLMMKCFEGVHSSHYL